MGSSLLFAVFMLLLFHSISGERINVVFYQTGYNPNSYTIQYVDMALPLAGEYSVVGTNVTVLTIEGKQGDHFKTSLRAVRLVGIFNTSNDVEVELQPKVDIPWEVLIITLVLGGVFGYAFRVLGFE
jgi:hypothetical protein